jgi:hypothetical protein
MPPIDQEKEDAERSARRKKVIAISVAASLGTMLVGWLIWYLIFSSQFATFSEKQYDIKIKYPRNWHVAPGYEGTIVAFVAPKEDELDGFQENLNVAVKDMSMSPMTLAEYTDLASKQMAAVFKNNIEVIESVPITLSGQKAHRYVVRAAQPQDLILTVVWFLKDNKAFTITHIGQGLRYDELYRAKFDEMVNSFSIPSL